MPESQPVRLKSPLPDSELLIQEVNVHDELGRLFVVDAKLLSPREDIGFDKLLGERVTISIDLVDGGTRFVDGFVSQFEQLGREGTYASYQMRVRPWLWFLTRTADCRIFQELMVPDIIKEVFREHGFSDFEDKLSGVYRTWEYCVQYRESDFDFVSRLMEQEGIYYYFRHEEGKHTLVLADGYGAHDPLPTMPEIPYFPPSDNVVREPHIFEWQHRRAIQPGTYVQRAFDFRKPRANLETSATVARQHSHSEYEVFEYPGEYFERGEGDAYAQARIEERQAGFERATAASDVREITAGGLFELKEFPREDQNKEYLIVLAQTHVSIAGYESGGGKLEYRCNFEVLDSQTAFRSMRLTPKPAMKGPQTAIVVGASGEEIWTDEYGRVKVQFHWDRYGKSDENSSCWVRVAQVWAGAKWGAMYIPRMGQEVIVDFIEGDPDRPIITGRVYNAGTMPPYDLPGDKTKSTIKSRSSKGGSGDNFNEIRFEDKIGEEEMYLHAEKDQTIVVENDKSESVGHDNSETIGNDETISVGNNRDKSVGVDQSETIGNNKTISVGTDHSEDIGSNKTLSVGVNHTETIGSNMSQTIGSNMTQNVGSNKTETIAVGKALTIGAGYQVSVGASMNQTIGASKSEQVAGNKSQNVGGSWSAQIGKDSGETIGSNKSMQVGKNASIQVGEKMDIVSGDDFTITGGKKGVIKFEDEMTIIVGKSTLVMKKNGDVLIDGKKINVKASGDIVMKGKKILNN